MDIGLSRPRSKSKNPGKCGETIKLGWLGSRIELFVRKTVKDGKQWKIRYRRGIFTLGGLRGHYKIMRLDGRNLVRERS